MAFLLSLNDIYFCLAFFIMEDYFFNSMTKPEPSSLKKLKLEDYDIGRTLGKGKEYFIRGGFGKVKVAREKKTGKYVAMKILKKAEVIKSQQVDHVFNENYVHSQLSSPFIVNFEGLTQDSKYLYLVLELVNGG